MPLSHETIVLLDFGAQYTQLIARRVREAHVYCEILPFNTPLVDILKRQPKGIILSGGPASVYGDGAPHSDSGLWNTTVPVLGICYGFQLLAHQLGGRVEHAEKREYGLAALELRRPSLLFDGVREKSNVWMSHGDHIAELPAGFELLGTSSNSLAAAEHTQRKLFGLQFHPEVAHTEAGRRIIENFLFNVCGCAGDWTPASFVEQSVARIRQQIGSGKAICALSGGVDSTVAAVLVDKAIGQNLTCIFVDNGLLRKNEFSKVLANLRERLKLKVTGVNASALFLTKLEGVIDPERKRKVIGTTFIEVFDAEAQKLGQVDFLVQGTLYPDVIESVSVKGPSATIKSHHNVGGLPAKMKLKLVEPLRELFKDEVRAIGRAMGLGDEIISRQPFPGPGLAVRIVGEVTPGRVRLLQEADDIVVSEIKSAGLYSQVWQSFAVLLPVRSVGVMGDERSYDYTVAVRAVHSQDGMTADWVKLPYEVLERISNRIVNEVKGINRVVYDISSKPPATIEWE
ncbi:MAG: glutamine-hydrolyzing GMP synthase [Acidobacteria bacterium]|nr:glutamine-hydrolyzing GMP synthase [Acidobacteriota bacterium]MCI0722952.1 glutamine-hydrolyzing GMP synthase [Acidobacteriota bacterium]